LHDAGKDALKPCFSLAGNQTNAPSLRIGDRLVFNTVSKVGQIADLKPTKLIPIATLQNNRQL